MTINRKMIGFKSKSARQLWSYGASSGGLCCDGVTHRSSSDQEMYFSQCRCF